MEDANAPVLAEDLEFETSKGVKPIVSFDNMKLKPLLIKGIYTFGFEKPSAIQQRAIVPITMGKGPYPYPSPPPILGVQC
jgi:superfamily II DNA/RNA helicase